MDEKKIISMVKKDFSFLKSKVLAVLIYGSIAKREATQRSDIDICIVAPESKPRDILKEVFRKVNVTKKRYDVYVFEELPMYMKAEVMKHHIFVLGDKLELYEYFYFVNKFWKDQEKRQRITEEELERMV